MIGEVVAIGDELTTGVRLDTNSQWIAQQLGDLGVQVRFHTAVGDELAPLVEVFRIAAARADVVVCTGGLGPTADDLTREALAQCAGVDLHRDEEVFAHIRGIYARRKRPMPERNVVQAMFPAGGRVIPNPHGTAPGIDMELPAGQSHHGRVFALPGVPAEMKQMWQATVAPAILQMIAPEERRVIRHRRLKCFGVGESDLEAMLPDLIARDYYPRVGITVSKATITLRVTAREATEAACLAAMEPTIAEMRNCLGDLIFGEEDDELQHVVGRLLAETNLTLATAEQFTGGLLASWLADIPELGDIFRAGRLLPSIPKLGEAGVRNLALELANDSGADAAIVVGTCDDPSADAGVVHYACAIGDQVALRTARNIGHPDIRKPRVAKAALDLLRKQLLKGP